MKYKINMENSINLREKTRLAIDSLNLPMFSAVQYSFKLPLFNMTELLFS